MKINAFYLKNQQYLQQHQDQLLYLSPREQQILRWHYGLDGEPMSLKEIAEQFGVTKERIRQVQQQALKKLQHLIEDSIETRDSKHPQ